MRVRTSLGIPRPGPVVYTLPCPVCVQISLGIPRPGPVCTYLALSVRTLPIRGGTGRCARCMPMGVSSSSSVRAPTVRSMRSAFCTCASSRVAAQSQHTVSPTGERTGQSQPTGSAPHTRSQKAVPAQWEAHTRASTTLVQSITVATKGTSHARISPDSILYCTVYSTLSSILHTLYNAQDGT